MSSKYITLFVKATLFFLLLFILGANTHAQLVYASKQTISNGLSDNGVTCLFKDSKGYLWVGTYDGLNRYNGYEFKVFKNTPNKRVLPGNRIRAFAEDKNGNVWIGTEQGICVYNYSLEKIEWLILPAKHRTTYKIRDIIIHPITNKAYCATEANGILIFNEDYSFSKRIGVQSKSQLYAGIQLNDSTHFYATNIGLLRYDIAMEQYTRVLPGEIGKCTSIIELNNKMLLVSSTEGIVLLKVLPNNKIEFEKRQFDTTTFTSCMISETGEVWLGTLNAGVWYLDDYHFLYHKYKKLKLIKNEEISRVSSIIQANNGAIWLGSYDKGLYRFSSLKTEFQHVSLDDGKKLGFKIDNITRIIPKGGQQAYLSGSFQDLVKIDFKDNSIKTPEYPVLLQNRNLTKNCLLIDSRNNRWMRMGGHNVLAVDSSGRRIIEFSSRDYSYFNQVKAIKEDKKGNIWIACDHDVIKVSFNERGIINKPTSLEKMGYFKKYKISQINNIYTDPLHQLIWLTTYYNGLFRIKLDNDEEVVSVDQYLHEFGNDKSISSNMVTAIIRLPNKQLWVGTEGGGICKVNNSHATPIFETFIEEDGLSNNIVRSFLAQSNYLWIATNNGLNRLNTDDKSFRNFTVEDGLPFESFRLGAAKLGNGLMVFSGYEGLMHFYPENINYKKNLPNLEFEEISILNRVVQPGDTIGRRVLLQQRLNEAKKIDLNYNENVFSISVVPLHYSNPANYFLKYRLLPTQEQWVEETSNQRNINFNGLQPGQYELQVMAGNQSQQWTEPKVLQISIQPPWWQKNIVRILFVLLILAIAGFFIRLRFRFLNLNHSLQIEQIEKDKVKEINTAKLRFFSNISHEIKTPLTLISVPVGILLDRFKEQSDVKEKLDIVQRQSLKIAKLIDQVHDFQRSDARLLELNKQHFSFDVFIHELAKEFDFMANSDGKNLSVHGEAGIYVWADKDKIEKVLNNLLNNAFKFTKPNDNISVDFKRQGKNLRVVVSDTGKGIDEEDLPHIFERFYQAKKLDSTNIGGSGVGLTFTKKLVEMHYGSINAESKKGEGTSITIDLPIVKDEDIDLIKKAENEILEAEKNFVSYSFLSGNQNYEHLKVGDEVKDAVLFFAEDNVDLRIFVTETLGRYFKVHSYKNGAELLTAMEKDWPDLIVSDVLMPEVNGFELCRQIKSDIKTSHIPIVLLTACVTVEDQIKGLEDGADLYIKKPFNIQHLVSGIESLLKSRIQLRKRFQLEVPLKMQDTDEENNHAFLVKLYALIDENLANTEIDLDSFAEQLYLNRTFFYQKIKALTNRTPFELLKSYRIKKAADLLLNEQVPVIEAFERTGFKSRPHFNKAFKEAYGQTPSQYATKAKK